MHMALVAPVHTGGVESHLLWAWVTPIPVLTARRGHVRGACHWGLVGTSHAPIELVLSMSLVVVL